MVTGSSLAASPHSATHSLSGAVLCDLLAGQQRLHHSVIVKGCANVPPSKVRKYNEGMREGSGGKYNDLGDGGERSIIQMLSFAYWLF